MQNTAQTIQIPTIKEYAQKHFRVSFLYYWEEFHYNKRQMTTKTLPIRSILPLCATQYRKTSISTGFFSRPCRCFLCSEMQRYRSSRWIFTAKHLGNTSFNIHWWVFNQAHSLIYYIWAGRRRNLTPRHLKKILQPRLGRVFRSGWRNKNTTLPMVGSSWHQPQQIQLKRLTIVFERQ